MAIPQRTEHQAEVWNSYCIKVGKFFELKLKDITGFSRKARMAGELQELNDLWAQLSQKDRETFKQNGFHPDNIRR